MFREALSIANENLLCQFDGKIYWQVREFAMGAASSPDLANLYGCFFEDRAGVHSHPDIPFYRRYIDDCLGLVYAKNKLSAKHLFENLILFDNCTIEWPASDSYMTFLDMMLFFDKDKSLQWRPYRKLLNYFEHIPWISTHPIYIKKGTFLSKLSWVAMLSSQYDTYVSACREVADIYIAHGYPPMLITSWLRENYSACWDARLNNSELTKADVLVLKSKYNVSWDFFNIQPLAE